MDSLLSTHTFLLSSKTALISAAFALFCLSACTPGQPQAVAGTPAIVLPDPSNQDRAPVIGFSSCPLQVEDVRLFRAIAHGEMVPDAQGDLDGVRLPLSGQDMNQWHDGVTAVDNELVPLVIDSRDPRPVFMAVFDGTWNDRSDADLPPTVPGILSRELEKSEASTPGLHVEYYRGVGTQGSTLRRWWEGATGNGTLERAEQALADFKAFASQQSQKPHVYVIGFSRGSASARHFLNLLDPLMQESAEEHFYQRGRSFAFLIDTVATGQRDVLNLNIPASTVSAIQFRATLERRFSFPIVPLQPSPSHSWPGHILTELLFPAVHADLGGGYGKGLESLSLVMARTLLVRQGFNLEEKNAQEQAFLNMGRHNSDWPGTSLGNALRDIGGVKARRVVELFDTSDKNPAGDSVLEQLETSMRVIAAEKARFNRSRIQCSNELGIWQGLSLQLISTEDGIVVSTNCPQFVQYDRHSRWFLLDGGPFMRPTVDTIREVDAGRGTVWTYCRQDPAHYISGKAP